MQDEHMEKAAGADLSVNRTTENRLAKKSILITGSALILNVLVIILTPALLASSDTINLGEVPRAIAR